jgi:hypothetical protein
VAHSFRFRDRKPLRMRLKIKTYGRSFAANTSAKRRALSSIVVNRSPRLTVISPVRSTGWAVLALRTKLGCH